MTECPLHNIVRTSVLTYVFNTMNKKIPILPLKNIKPYILEWALFFNKTST